MQPSIRLDPKFQISSPKAMSISPASRSPSGEAGTPRSPTSPVLSHHSSAEAPSQRPPQVQQRSSAAGRGFSISSLLCPADNVPSAPSNGSSPPNGTNASADGQETDRDRDPNANSNGAASASAAASAFASAAASQSIADVLARMAGAQSLEHLLSRAWLLAAAQQTAQPTGLQNLPHGQIQAQAPDLQPPVSAGEVLPRDTQQGVHSLSYFMLS